MDRKLILKYEHLQQYLRELDSVAVAFSSGVDSTLLLKVAHDTLGDKAIAITAQSCLLTHRESAEAKEFCKREGIRQFIYEANPFGVEGFAQNPPNRCYLCKYNLFSGMIQLANEQGIHYVAEGSNLDDDGDYRPGKQAIRELNVTSPLYVAGMTKADIRAISKELGLPTWQKPSFACLASRFAYGETITEEGLARVEQAEMLLSDMGFYQFRVRVHGNLARIEVLPEEMERLMLPQNREKVTKELKKAGFSYVTLDLGGYRTGSMNEVLTTNK